MKHKTCTRRAFSLLLALALCASLPLWTGGAARAYDMGKAGRTVTVSAGGYHTAALKSDGSLWMWGENNNGELGIGDREDRSTPVKVLDGVAAVSAGTSHTAALKADGSLWMCGWNGYGQLGFDGGNATGSLGPIQTTPVQVMDNVMLPGGASTPTPAEPAPQTTTEPAQPTPCGQLAYASTQNVELDGAAVEFQCYALKDANGNDTNYIKLRDLAMLLNGSAAQFEVGWDGSINIQSHTAYTSNGSELSTPFSGNRAYQNSTAVTKIDGSVADLAAITLTDDSGGGYTYYKLRDLGRALNFNVGWSAARGLFIETDKPYTDAD